MSFRRVHLLPALAAAMLSASSAIAQLDHANTQCAAPTELPAALAELPAALAELPAALASWRSPGALRAAADRKGTARAVLTPGKTVEMALLRTPLLTYPVRPAKPGGTVSYGGLASFTVREAGTWRVALGSGAWVDVVKDGKAATSIAHGHGPDCSGIRKMVDYALEPGRYILQIAANGEESLTLLVTRLP